MLVHRIDDTGRCQATNYPTHRHLYNVLATLGLDHVLYYPPEYSDTEARLVVYLSLSSPVVIVVHPETLARVPPKDLTDIYRWVQQYAKVHAYRFVTTDVLRPTPNESKATREKITEWCDGHLDAFTVFRCKQLLLERGKVRKRART